MKQLSERQQKILTDIAILGHVSPKNFKSFGVSRVTFARDMEVLINLGFISRYGKGPSTTYTQGVNFPLAPVIVTGYFEKDQDSRHVNAKKIDFGALPTIFSSEELEELELLGHSWYTRYQHASETIKKKEFEKLTIELAWKSSQIEGNTYTLLDTERLIKERQEAEGHPHEEAVMILNHKRALEYIRDYKQFFLYPTKKEIENVHSLLVEGLHISKGLRSGAVGIVGTNYKPYDNIFQIGEQLESFIKNANHVQNGLSLAFLTLLSILYIQPFEDGNKRTSRMVSNAILLAHNLPPFSYRSIDEVEYKKAVILLYEAGSIYYLKKLFIEQFRLAATSFL